MGQAKQRGNFEHRKTLAIQKEKEARVLKKQQDAEYEASLTDEQRKARMRTRVLLATMSSITAGSFIRNR